MHKLLAILLTLLACTDASWAQADSKSDAIPKSLVPAELIPPAPPRSPEEELATFQVTPGVRIELAASDPLISHPVAVAFDPDGRMWVVEMRGYMPNLEGTGEDQPVGRVSVLTDTDGDGRMDKSQVFLDGLVMPRSIILVRDGALIGAPPYLWFCRDTDGDGRSDEQTEVAQDYGFAIDPNNIAIGEPENKPNNPLWAFDNWIYTGHYTGKFRWRNGAWERGMTSARGQWGLTQDDWGRLFNNSNSDQLRADIIPAQYLGRNPHFPRPRGRGVAVATDQSVWPIRVNPGINRGYLPDMLRDYKLKNFTSACAPWIYRGDLFPAEFYGNAFVCEPAGNLVKRNILTTSQGVPTAREAYGKREFLASTDERFRPVNLTTGPDGALYLCDMYHGIIQHRVSVTKYLEEQVKARGLDQPTGLGRIWRVVPEKARQSAPPRLTQETPAQWVAHLSHGNAWWRETAQRLLVERADPAVVPALETLAAEGKPMGRVHALWTLDGLQQLRWPVAARALDDRDPRVRAAAIRMQESFLSTNDRPELLAQWIALAQQESVLEVQLQLALSLGEARDPAADDAMIELYRRAPDNVFLRDAVLTGVGGRELEILERALPIDDLNLDPLLTGLAGCVLGERQPERIERLLDTLAAMPSAARNRQAALLTSFTTGVLVTPRKPVKLGAEPGAWSRLRENASLKAALDRAGTVFNWPGKPGAALDAQVAPLTAAQQTRFETGKMLYTATCGACHQPHGLGLDGLAPPLADSEWVVGSVERLGRIAINGVRGPIKVDGRRYSLDMPAWGVLDDPSLAAIFTYIRREWGHTAAPVEPETIKKIRAAVAGRHDAWTEPELLKVK